MSIAERLYMQGYIRYLRSLTHLEVLALTIFKALFCVFLLHFLQVFFIYVLFTSVGIPWLQLSPYGNVAVPLLV